MTLLNVEPVPDNKIMELVALAHKMAEGHTYDAISLSISGGDPQIIHLCCGESIHGALVAHQEEQYKDKGGLT